METDDIPTILTDNIPTLGQWMETLPVWKQILFTLCQSLPLLDVWALDAFGYSKAKRDPSLPRDAIIEKPYDQSNML